MNELNYDLIPEELKQELIEEACREGDLAQNIMHKVNFTNLQRLCREAYRFASQHTKKPVDMSVFEGTEILMEASNRKFNISIPKLGFLKHLGFKYKLSCGSIFEYCQPLYGHWNSEKNFDDAEELVARLEHAGFEVDVEYLIGKLDSFCITGMQSDRCEPWEV